MRFRLSPWLIAALFLAAFAALHSGAYGGFFSDDDLDNLAWNSFVGFDEYVRGFFDWKLSPHNFRPVGHLYFWLMTRLAGDYFPAYVAVIQLLHLVNAGLLFLLLRREASPAAALAGTAVWTFHFAFFDAVWKPMYIFDVTCGLFCLVTMHAWQRQRWVLAALSFWCAYKAKEVAIFLPLALLAAEFVGGRRRWKGLVPLFAISANFGLQALFAAKGPETAYSMKLSGEALRTTSSFYFAAFLPAFFGNLLGGLLMLVPLLLLPGRLFEVYVYVPLLVAALGWARWKMDRRLTVLLFAVMAVADFSFHRQRRRAYRPMAYQHRAYVTQLADYVRANPHLRELFYEGAPPGMNAWGVEGALHWYSRNAALQVRPANGLPQKAPVLRWDGMTQRVRVEVPRPPFRLGKGWWPEESNGLRWTAGIAELDIAPGAESRTLSIRIVVPEQQPRPVSIALFSDGQLKLERQIVAPGEHSLQLAIPASDSPRRLELRGSPVFRVPNDDRTLSLAVAELTLR